MGKKNRNRNKKNKKNSNLISEYLKKLYKNNKLPKVSLCTPTFNRRPFIPMLINCMNRQTYPKKLIEWIIVDDGTDKIEDLIIDIPYIKYTKYDVKLNLGKKRNIMNNLATGEILIYIDDDDFYPMERVEHAVESLLLNPDKICAGSSEIYLYYNHINKMYQSGPFGDNHATAASFAFRKKLLDITKFSENASVSEEANFLKNYTIPMVQLDPLKTILVFSHEQNTLDKTDVLSDLNKAIKLSDKKVNMFIKDEEIKEFYTNKIHDLLKNYKEGSRTLKPKALIQVNLKLKERMKMLETHIKNIIEIQNKNNVIQIQKPNNEIVSLTMVDAVNHLNFSKKKIYEQHNIIIACKNKINEQNQIILNYKNELDKIKKEKQSVQVIPIQNDNLENLSRESVSVSSDDDKDVDKNINMVSQPLDKRLIPNTYLNENINIENNV